MRDGGGGGGSLSMQGLQLLFMALSAACECVTMHNPWPPPQSHSHFCRLWRDVLRCVTARLFGWLVCCVGVTVTRTVLVSVRCCSFGRILFTYIYLSLSPWTIFLGVCTHTSLWIELDLEQLALTHTVSLLDLFEIFCLFKAPVSHCGTTDCPKSSLDSVLCLIGMQHALFS